jgi:hypothetical protein
MKVRLTASPRGAVLSARADDGPLGTMPVVLDGDVLVAVDPLAPETLTRIEVPSLQPLARETLAELIGTDAAERVVRLADAAVLDGATTPDDEIEIEPTSWWPLLARLGFLTWLEEFSLLPLDRRDLDLEIGELAARLSPLGGWRIAEERLTRAFDHGLELLDDAAAPGRQTVEAALRAAVDDEFAGVDPEQVARLDRVVATGGAPVVERRAAKKASRLWDASPFGPAESFALAASPGESAVAYSVDWRRVPRDVLATGEKTIHWSWTDDPAPRLSVNVEAAPDTALRGGAAHSLMFEVVSRSTGQALVAAPLELDEGRTHYRGVVRFSHAPGDDEVIEVYSLLSELAPAVSQIDRHRLEGARAATRGFLSERLLTADGAFDEAMLELESTAAYWIAAANAFGSAKAAGGGEHDGVREEFCRERASAILSGPDAAAWTRDLPAPALAELVLVASRDR